MKGEKMKKARNECNIKARKYQLTINNPDKHENCSHTALKEILENMHGSLIYYCMCDEIGSSENTLHTHLYFEMKNPISFNSIKKAFPFAHIEKAYGSAKENRDYIRKEGKYESSEKAETNKIETFEEFGDFPIDEEKTKKGSTNELYNLIKAGLSDAELLEINPKWMYSLKTIKTVRNIILSEKFGKCERENIEVIYVCGEPRLGKTSLIPKTYGYENVYLIKNYKHPFDKYVSQDVIVFDEFRNSLPLSEMLDYLDNKPCQLDARFENNYACYTKVFVISNWDFEEQYKDIQKEHPVDWRAFVSRFQKIRLYTGFLKYEEIDMKEYLQNPSFYHTLLHKSKISDNKDNLNFENDTLELPFLNF